LITDTLLETINREPKIVKYLDIPLQHCDGEILAKMNRRGDEASMKRLTRRIREKVPGIVLRTTFIVGFPGETEEQFASLAEFVRDMKFERMGCFAYSPEEDTPAAEFDGKIDEDTKNRRVDILMYEQSLVSNELAQAKIGKNITVLVEGYDDYIKCWFGRSEADAPEIDCKIFFISSKKLTAGDFVNVNITDTIEYDLMGEHIY